MLDYWGQLQFYITDGNAEEIFSSAPSDIRRMFEDMANWELDSEDQQNSPNTVRVCHLMRRRKNKNR